MLEHSTKEDATTGIGIAVYGKGGIGKSTVSANLSYALSSGGVRVAQIGCDPKHDSTRLLLKNQRTPTVLDVIRTTRPSERRLEDFTCEGINGITCIEAGGPEPGVGCAGKGILSMFNTLDRLGFDSIEKDVTVYDVLGDVVCGGFAVPMRPEHTDAVVIVTSGEFMSIYAANNIMKGLLSFETSEPRLAGIVFNSRGSDSEERMVEAFSEATGVPIIARIPRSPLFAEAEAHGHTLCELFPGSEEARMFDDLADTVLGIGDGRTRMFFPEPLTDEQLDQLASGSGITGRGGYRRRKTEVPPVPKKCPECGFAPIRRIGMGPIGAAVTAAKVSDVPVVIHGTRACGYGMINEIRGEIFATLSNDPDSSLTPCTDNTVCSGVEPTDAVFGGARRLEETLEVLAQKHQFVIVVITCLTNMIGDDTSRVVRSVESRHPGFKVAVVNGNEAVEGVDAHMEVLRALADMIDTTVEPSGHTVRILDDSFTTLKRGRNTSILKDLLKPLGRTVEGGFLDDCLLEDVVNLRRNELLYRYDDSPNNLALASIVSEKGVRVARRRLPRGYREGRDWILHMGKMFRMPEEAEEIAKRMDSEFSEAVNESSPFITGRRIAVIHDGSDDVSWICETLAEAHAKEVVIHSVAGPCATEPPFEVRVHPNRVTMTDDVLFDRPDLVIGPAYLATDLGDITFIETPGTTLAHAASILLLEKVSNTLRCPQPEKWRTWGGE